MQDHSFRPHHSFKYTITSTQPGGTFIRQFSYYLSAKKADRPQVLGAGQFILFSFQSHFMTALLGDLPSYQPVVTVGSDGEANNVRVHLSVISTSCT